MQTHANTTSLSSKNICFIVTRQWQLSSGDLTHNCELAAWAGHSLFAPYHIHPQFPYELQNHIFPSLCLSHTSFWMSAHLLPVFQCPNQSLWSMTFKTVQHSDLPHLPKSFFFFLPRRLKQGALYLKLPFMSPKCYCKTNKCMRGWALRTMSPYILHKAIL